MKKTVNYNKKVTLQYKSGSQVVDGIETPIYIDGAIVWAAAEPLKGREFWEAQAAQSEQTIRFTIRYMPGVDASWRIKCENIIYSIANIIDPNLRHRELQLICKVVG